MIAFVILMSIGYEDVVFKVRDEGRHYLKIRNMAILLKRPFCKDEFDVKMRNIVV